MSSRSSSRPAQTADIWVICGSECAGKTTTARLLTQRLPLAARIEGDDLQRLIVSGCRWATPGDNDPGTGRLTGEAGVQYALRIRKACLMAAAFADAGITAVVTDTIVNEGFESLTDVLAGRQVRPPTWRTATATQTTPRPRRSPTTSEPQPRAGRSTSSRRSSSGASIACRTSDSVSIRVALIRTPWWTCC